MARTALARKGELIRRKIHGDALRRNTCYLQRDRAMLHGTVTFVFRNYQFRFNASMDLPSP